MLESVLTTLAAGGLPAAALSSSENDWLRFQTSVILHQCTVICASDFCVSLPGRFIRYNLLVPGWTPFVSRAALIFGGTDSTRY